MSGTKQGFTFLELVVVIILLGLLATIIVPNLRQLGPRYKRQEFVTQVSSLLRFSWQRALSTQKAHRLFFDLKKGLVRIEQEEPTADSSKKEIFVPVVASYLNTSYVVPDGLVIKQFYIGQRDAMKQPGVRIEQVWFYIVPDGLVQPVVINIIDENDIDVEGKALSFSLVGNPFTAQLREYDAFQKP